MQLLEDFFRPILEDLLDAASKLVGHGAIDQTVIEGESEIADGPNGEFVTFTLMPVDGASDPHVPFLLHWPGQRGRCASRVVVSAHSGVHTGGFGWKVANGGAGGPVSDWKLRGAGGNHVPLIFRLAKAFSALL